MKNILNKRSILVVVLIVALSIMASVTYSFYVDDDSVENKMKMATSIADIVEEFDGDEKIVSVTNNGNTPLLVRANARLVLTNGDIILDASKVTNTKYNTYEEDDNGVYWVYGEDGWYYYNKLLLPEETSEMFVHITTDITDVPDDEKTLYDNSELDVPVNLEYYLPLKSGSIYTHEEAWNIDGESDLGKLLRELVDTKA